MSGRIVLYDFDGSRVASYRYASQKARLERLATWRHQVGLNRYEKMYYHIIPDVRPDLVSKIGTNKYTNKRAGSLAQLVRATRS